MKKSWIITVILCLLLLGGGCVAAFLPRTVPFYKCSDEYKKYSRVDGVEASFIKDFRINDTLTVDVTMLKAVDSIGWETLLSDFDIKTPPDVFLQRIYNGEDLIICKSIFANDTTHNPSSDPKTKAIIATSHLNHRLIIFDITDNSHIQAIFQYTYPYPNKTTNNNKK